MNSNFCILLWSEKILKADDSEEFFETDFSLTLQMSNQWKMDVWPRRASFQKQAKHVSWPPLKHHEAKTLSSMQSLSRIETPILKRNMTCQTFFLMLIWQSSTSVSEMQIPSHQMTKIPSVFVEHQPHQSPTAKKTWGNNSNLLKLIPVKPTQMFFSF